MEHKEDNRLNERALDIFFSAAFAIKNKTAELRRRIGNKKSSSQWNFSIASSVLQNLFSRLSKRRRLWVHVRAINHSITLMRCCCLHGLFCDRISDIYWPLPHSLTHPRQSIRLAFNYLFRWCYVLTNESKFHIAIGCWRGQFS